MDDERAIREEIRRELTNSGCFEIDLGSLPTEPETWRRYARKAARSLKRPVETYLDDEYVGAWLTDFPSDDAEYYRARMHLRSTILLAHGEYTPTTASTTPAKELSSIEVDHLIDILEQVQGGVETVSIAWRPRLRPLTHWLMLIELSLEHDLGSAWVARDIAEIIVVTPWVPSDPSMLTE